MPGRYPATPRHPKLLLECQQTTVYPKFYYSNFVCFVNKGHAGQEGCQQDHDPSSHSHSHHLTMPSSKRKSRGLSVSSTGSNSANHPAKKAKSSGPKQGKEGAVSIEEIEDEGDGTATPGNEPDTAPHTLQLVKLTDEQLEEKRGQQWSVHCQQETLTSILSASLLKVYNSHVYVLYHPPTLFQDEENRLTLSFKCARPGCKQKKPFNRCEEKGASDKAATGRLWNHAKGCWGLDKVREVRGAGSAREAGAKVQKQKQGTLTVYYENAKGKGELLIGIRNQPFEELRYAPLVSNLGSR